MKRRFILVIKYQSIELYEDFNKKIKKISFSNGKEVLSNCITFSYDKEDLEFLPDGNIFTLNCDSSLSDYLDFAGYHFDSVYAIEVVVSSIIKLGFIPNLNKCDDIYIFFENTYYEDDSEVEDEAIPKKMDILGFNITTGDILPTVNYSKTLLMDFLCPSIIIIFPFLTYFIFVKDNQLQFLSIPALNLETLSKAKKVINVKENISKDVYRIVKRKYMFSKFTNSNVNMETKYQNRKIDFAYSQFDEMVKVIQDCDSTYLKEALSEVKDKKTVVFDFGAADYVKGLLKDNLEDCIFATKEENATFTNFLLRNFLIHSYVTNDMTFFGPFKKFLLSNPSMKNDVMFKIENETFYLLDGVWGYCNMTRRNNIVVSAELQEIVNLHNKYLIK